MTAETRLEQSYEDLPYTADPQPFTHPCHLALIATLFGRKAISVDNCRILELGCADGGNILPVASDYRSSQFVGIDLSSRQIAQARTYAEQLGLANIEFHCGNILEVREQYGHFDYIICHGVYSWVSGAVQDHILAIGRELLSPDGIMYVSYNTYPGWHLRGIVRDLFSYHSRSFQSTDEKLAQSRGLLKFLVESPSTAGETYRQVLIDEAEHLNGKTDSSVFHEHLEEHNTPLYFHEFIERVDQAGLRYLGDADLSQMMIERFDDETAEALNQASLLEQEQYMDFLTCRSFRRSLICHPAGEIDRTITKDRLHKLSFSLAEPLDSRGEEVLETEFVGQSRSITTNHPVFEALLAQLADTWPSWQTAKQLADQIHLVLGQSAGTELIDEIHEDLVILICRGVVLARKEPRPVATSPTETPRANAWARLQSALSCSTVTNCHHQPVAMPVLHIYVLSRLDGTRTRQKLLDEVTDAFRSGDLVLKTDDGTSPIGDSAVAKLLDSTLGDLANYGLLIPND
jgi:methyltransferase-like protein/2-polyprenyl-3-methyl-5-hydroxy-6-metoxy-1,4-benzoquinol methylase